MRSCNTQGLAVGAETRGFRRSGNMQSGDYNHSQRLLALLDRRNAARRRRRQSCPAKSCDGDAANELWRLLDYVWTQSTLGQRPGFQCAGIDPKLCTSVANKDSAARSLQLGGLPVGVMPAQVYGTGRTGFWQTAYCGKAISSFGLIITALQRQKCAACTVNVSKVTRCMQGVRQASTGLPRWSGACLVQRDRNGAASTSDTRAFSTPAGATSVSRLRDVPFQGCLASWASRVGQTKGLYNDQLWEATQLYVGAGPLAH
jgi:hypothetical protein